MKHERNQEKHSRGRRVFAGCVALLAVATATGCSSAEQQSNVANADAAYQRMLDGQEAEPTGLTGSYVSNINAAWILRQAELESGIGSPDALGLAWRKALQQVGDGLGMNTEYHRFPDLTQRRELTPSLCVSAEQNGLFDLSDINNLATLEHDFQQLGGDDTLTAYDEAHRTPEAQQSDAVYNFCAAALLEALRRGESVTFQPAER